MPTSTANGNYARQPVKSFQSLERRAWFQSLFAGTNIPTAKPAASKQAASSGWAVHPEAQTMKPQESRSLIRPLSQDHPIL